MPRWRWAALAQCLCLMLVATLTPTLSQRARGEGSLALWERAGVRAAAAELPDIRPFQTANFTFESRMGTMGFEFTFAGDGALVLPDATRVKLEFFGEEIEVIRIGDRSYLRSGLFGDAEQWYLAPPEAAGEGIDDAFDANPLNALRLAGSLENLAPQPDAIIEGVPAEHYRADLDPQVLDQLLSRSLKARTGTDGSTTLLEGMPISRATLEVWIAKTTRYLLQQRVVIELTIDPEAAGTDASGQVPTGTWPLPGAGRRATPTPTPAPVRAPRSLKMTQQITYRFSDHDAPITIAPPAGAVPMPR